MLLSLKTLPPTRCWSLTRKYSLANTVTQTGGRVLPGLEEDTDPGSFIGSEDSLVCPRGLFGLIFPEVLSLPPLTHYTSPTPTPEPSPLVPVTKERTPSCPSIQSPDQGISNQGTLNEKTARSGS